MVASRRNRALRALAQQVGSNQVLCEGLSRVADRGWQDLWQAVQAIPGGAAFVRAFEQFAGRVHGCGLRR